MTESRPGRIFISYRRQETAWPARQLYDVVVKHFGAKQVFKDVDNIEPGDDFVDRITSAVSSCDVLLALIGPHWLTITDETGRRRLDNPEDFVRLEIETALTRQVRVIPILVDDARMPNVNELPAGLSALVRRQAVEISPITFDTERLMTTVHDTLAVLHSVPAKHTPPAPPDGREPVPRSSRRGRILGGVSMGVAALALVVAAVIWWPVDPKGVSTEAPPGSSSPTSTISPSAPTPSATTPTRSPTTPPPPSTPTDGPAIVAHRGGWEEYPLETLRALTSAAQHGFAVETDVRWTSDNQAVLVHDEAATKGLECTQPYEVSQTTWRELSENCQSYPDQDGQRYPISTYADAMEALAAIPGSQVYVEVKTDQTEEQTREFLDVIRDNGMSKRTVVTSSSRERLNLIRQAAPDLPRMLFLSGEQISAQELGPDGDDLWGVAVHDEIVTEEYVRQLKDVELTVLVWLLNEEPGWAKARDVGATKVITDNPQAYSTWLDGQPAP